MRERSWDGKNKRPKELDVRVDDEKTITQCAIEVLSTSFEVWNRTCMRSLLQRKIYAGLVICSCGVKINRDMKSFAPMHDMPMAVRLFHELCNKQLEARLKSRSWATTLASRFGQLCNCNELLEDSSA